MTELQPNPKLVSLEAQLSSVISAMNMHIERAEALAAETERLKDEIAAIQEGPTK